MPPAPGQPPPPLLPLLPSFPTPPLESSTLTEPLGSPDGLLHSPIPGPALAASVDIYGPLWASSPQSHTGVPSVARVWAGVGSIVPLHGAANYEEPVKSSFQASASSPSSTPAPSPLIIEPN
eukprot:RCo051234